MKSMTKKELNEKHLIAAPEAALLCGYSVKKWKYMSFNGQAPAGILINYKLRWNRDVLLDWIKAGRPNTRVIVNGFAVIKFRTPIIFT